MATQYFFGSALPFFLTSYFIFGLFPVLCKYMKLVQEQQKLLTQYPDLALSYTLANSFDEKRRQPSSSML